QHHPPAAVGGLHQVGVAGVLDGAGAAAVGQQGVAGCALPGAARRAAAGHGHAVAAFRAALRDEQVPPVADAVQVRCLGELQAGSGPGGEGPLQHLSPDGVDPGHVDAPGGAGEGAPAGAVLLPREVGVDAGQADPHRVAPRPLGPLGRDDEGAAAVDVGVDDPVTAVVVTDRGGVEPAGRLGAGEGQGQLCGAVQHVADLLPVHQVLAVEQRQSGDVLEAGAHQVVVVADPAHARIGVEPADHRVVVEVHGTCSLRGAGQRPLRHDGRPVRAAARTAAALTLSGAVLARDVSGAGPALVVAVGAGVDLDLGAVGGAGAHGVQALAGLDADDGTVGVQTPLLVVAAPAAVDLDFGAVAGAGGVQALVAVDPELTGAGQRPLLVGAVVAVVELDLGAVGRAGVGHVQAAARGDALDGGAVTGLRVRVRVAAVAPVEGVQHGAVRLLLAAVVVEQQRSVLRTPGVAVADAPDGDAEAAGDGQAVVDHGGVGGRRGALDVELGDGHVDSEGGELTQRGAEVAVVGAAAVEVRLEADAVD